MNKLPSYARRIEEFQKRVVRMKFQVKYFSKFPGVKDKPVVISEGDSWFDFPLKSLTEYFGFALKKLVGLQGFAIDDKSNIVDHLSDDMDLQLLRIERSGDISDELAAETPDQRGGVKEKDYPSSTLAMVLKVKDIAQHVDVILLSAGGNDMVNHAQKHCILPFTTNWQNSCETDSLKETAIAVRANFIRALQLRDQYAPQAKVITHSYCHAVHTSRGTPITFDTSVLQSIVDFLLPKLGLGWLEPLLKTLGARIDDTYTIQNDAHLHAVFDQKGWPANEDDQVNPQRAEFIRFMLQTLYDVMSELPSEYERVTGQPLKGYERLDTLDACQSPEFWMDYIHLNSEGYKQIADRFKLSIQQQMQVITN